MDELRLYHILNSRLEYVEAIHESEQKVLDLIENYSIFTKRVKGKDESPLQWAVANSSIAFLNEILKNGVKPKPAKLLTLGMSYYHGAYRPLNVLKVFQSNGYQIDSELATSFYLSLIAEEYFLTKQSTNDFECFRYLFSLGADINAFQKTNWCMNGLMSSFAGQSPELTKFLLELGADPNLTNKNEVTPLIFACGKPPGGGMELLENTAIVQMLLDSGADIHYRIGKTQDALYWAKRSKNQETVKLVQEYIEKRKGI